MIKTILIGSIIVYVITVIILLTIWTVYRWKHIHTIRDILIPKSELHSDESHELFGQYYFPFLNIFILLALIFIGIFGILVTIYESKMTIKIRNLFNKFLDIKIK